MNPTLDQSAMLPIARTHRTPACDRCGAWQVVLTQTAQRWKLSSPQTLRFWVCADEAACGARMAAKQPVAAGPARVSDVYPE